MGLLESATARPFLTVFGEYAYPGPFDKAGALFHSLILNHPFLNGNKRTALVSTMVYLASIGFWVEKCSDEEMYDFTVSVAGHEVAVCRDKEVEAISGWLENNSIRLGPERKPIRHQPKKLENVQQFLSSGYIKISYSVSEIIEFRRIYVSASNMIEERNDVIIRLAKT